MLRPFTIARYGVYCAGLVALLSVWLGSRAGASLDYAMLRAVFFFVIVSALGFGAEAVLLLTPPPPPPAHGPEAPDSTETLE